MENFRGTLLKDGQAITGGLDGKLTVDLDANRTEHWSGFFTVPAGVDVQISERYELQLEDGRQGAIKVERVNQTGQGAFASFVSGN
ncbi:MAG: hypothetical protein AB7K24_16165 [Gemmataceae bacterium]